MFIRPYRKKEYSKVVEILKENGSFDAVWDSEKHWNTKIEKNNQSILVAEKESEIVGCILVVQDDWTSFIFRLAVKKTHQSTGIGSALIQAAETYLKSQQVDEVAIFVDENNQKLQTYYEKKGYQRGGNYRCLYKNLNK